MKQKKNITEKEMKEFINANLNLIPKRTVSKFGDYDLETQYKKICIWKRINDRKNEEKDENVLVVRIKRMFDTKGVSVEDVKEVVSFCNTYIEEVKKNKLNEIEKEIERLNNLKKELSK